MTLQDKINELNQAYAVAFVAEGSNAMTPEIEQRLQDARQAVQDEIYMTFQSGYHRGREDLLAFQREAKCIAKKAKGKKKRTP